MSIAQISVSPLPPARPAASEPSPSGEGDFAQLMAQQAPAEPVDGDAAQTRTDDARQTKARQAARMLARGTPAEARRDTADCSDAARKPGEAAETDPGGEATDPALAQWLAQWHRPAEQAAAPEGGEAKTSLPESAGIETAEKPSARPTPDAALPTDGRAGHGPAAPRGHEKAGHDRSPALEALSTVARDEVASATSASREPAPATPATGFTLPAGFEPASAAAAPSSPAQAAPDAGVVSVPLPVPLESPEFAAAFGVEISLLAKDGVQQAELHLNPAEMGPVSVQIALDGEKARIDFGAQAATTRAAIEASLPELAAALRDAGLTLAGGGVTQHTGQQAGQRGSDQRDRDAGEARVGRSDRADVLPAVAPRPAWRGRVSASGVDLYA